MTHGAIATARTFSDAKLAELRGVIGRCVPKGAVVVACGSFARREASASSDFDHFIILPDAATEGDADPAWVAALRDAIASVVPVEPARGGPFAQLEHLPGMVRNMGGQGDTNQRLTRRMLFLLEGEPLTDVAGLPRRPPHAARALYRAAGRPRHAAALPAQRPDPLLPHHRGRLRVQDQRGRQALGSAQPEARLLAQAALCERPFRHRGDARRAGRRQDRAAGGVARPDADRPHGGPLRRGGGGTDPRPLRPFPRPAWSSRASGATSSG